MPDQTLTATVPPMFHDHYRKFGPTGTEVGRTKVGVTVQLTDGECRELVAAAEYYAAEPAYIDREHAALKRSAASTVVALHRAAHRAGRLDLRETLHEDARARRAARTADTGVTLDRYFRAL